MAAGLVIAGKYHVVQLIAQGGMGAVYDAINVKTGRRVALKLLNERGLGGGRTWLRRFEREAKATAAVDSVHVVQVLDAGEDEASGVPFIVMEYLQGEDLRSVLRRGPLPADEAIAIAKQVCLGLVKAHAADIIHRDLKPANLFLAEAEGGERSVKILDFGVAKLLDEDDARLTKTGDLVGSPAYMSPEQLTSPRDVDHRTDLWALGVVLYEMLSGETPTSRIEPMDARIHAIRHAPATPLAERVSGIRPDLAALVDKALQLDRTCRFASAEEMLDALRAAAPERIVLRAPRRRAHGDDGAPALELAPTEPGETRSPRRGAWAAALAVAVVVAGVSFATMKRPSPDDAAPRATTTGEGAAGAAPGGTTITMYEPPMSGAPSSHPAPSASTVPLLRAPFGARKHVRHLRKSPSDDGGAGRSVPGVATGRDQL